LKYKTKSSPVKKTDAASTVRVQTNMEKPFAHPDGPQLKNKEEK